MKLGSLGKFRQFVSSSVRQDWDGLTGWTTCSGRTRSGGPLPRQLKQPLLGCSFVKRPLSLGAATFSPWWVTRVTKMTLFQKLFFLRILHRTFYPTITFVIFVTFGSSSPLSACLASFPKVKR